MSMPLSPQQYVSAGAGAGGGSGEVSTPNDTVMNVNNRPAKPRGSSRVLGDYTLGKTLGAGSMGKVKLAYHNLTGEKVRNLRISLV